MKRSELKNALSWFKYDNYDAIWDLTLEEFWVEIDRRIIGYNMLKRCTDLDDAGKNQLLIHCDKIICGDVLFGGETNTPEHILASSYAIVPLLRREIPYCVASLKLAEMASETKGHGEGSEYVSQYFSEMGVNSKGSIVVTMNLMEASSDELIEHLRMLIPKWKKQLKTPEPEVRDYRFGISTLKKVLNYRLIPLMDLIFWEELKDTKIPFSKLEELLYGESDDYRTADLIKATDYPLALGFLTTPTYIKSFQDYIIKNDYLKDAKIRDHLVFED